MVMTTSAAWTSSLSSFVAVWSVTGRPPSARTWATTGFTPLPGWEPAERTSTRSPPWWRVRTWAATERPELRMQA
jgi:hypothetical protein